MMPCAARQLGALLVTLSLLLPLARAEEELGGDPWAGGEGVELDPAGMPDEEREQADGQPVLPARLLRCRMDALESARYSIAELRLGRGDAKGAIAGLIEVLEATKRETLRDVTNLNLAILHERWLQDTEAASRHYRALTGILRHTAQRRLLAMLARTGKADDAAQAATDELIAKAKEKGEKLALLHRLALTYKRHNLPDRALAVYQRISKEYTPDDLKQILDAIEREVTGAIERFRRLQQAGQDAEAEALQASLNERRPQELRAAGRWDELAAFERARDRGFRRLEQLEQGAAEREEGQPPKKAEF